MISVSGSSGFGIQFGVFFFCVVVGAVITGFLSL